MSADGRPPDHSTLETMNTQEAKVVLEAALLTSEQPLSVSELRRLFNDELNADTIRVLLDELRTDWTGRGVELAALATGWRFQSAALMRPYLDRLNPERPPKYSRAVLRRSTHSSVCRSEQVTSLPLVQPGYRDGPVTFR